MDTLTSAERLRGWVEFHCPAHGFLVATTFLASVVCSCGKRAWEYRDGGRLDRWERRRLAGSLNVQMPKSTPRRVETLVLRE